MVAPSGGAKLIGFYKFLNSTRKYWRNSSSIPYGRIEFKLKGGKKTFQFYILEQLRLDDQNCFSLLFTKVVLQIFLFQSKKYCFKTYFVHFQ